MKDTHFFPRHEYEERRERVRRAMAEQELDALLISSPENIYYLCGLDHQGYFAYQLLILPLDSEPILITRAMEWAIVRDQVPDTRHIGYSDGIDPLPPPADRSRDLLLATQTREGDVAGLQPWSMSYGIPSRKPGEEGAMNLSAPVRATCQALKDAGLGAARLGIEKNSTFLPFLTAEGIVEGLPDAKWKDASGLVNDVRIVQSPFELRCTRQAAAISDSMMLSAIAAAGPGVFNREVMASLYQTMFLRGGTYPGFVPLVRSTLTLQHEHGTWRDRKLASREILFLEMSGCIRRYHAPIGRLVFIGKAPNKAETIQKVCNEAMQTAASAIKPGVVADEVYREWKGVLDRAGLSDYHRHHCGYAVGIGYPPSWSGSGVPLGLRPGSNMELKQGMVFHLMSWLLRTGKGDSFLSDTIVVTDNGCEFLTTVSHDVCVR